MAARAHSLRTHATALAVASLLAVLAVLTFAGPAAAVYHRRDDWRHVATTLAALQAEPPAEPVVYWLGGSSAREAIITEPNWRRQIAALGGGRVRAFNFGAASQAFEDCIEIVRAAPDVPSIFLIGLNVGRYCCMPPEQTLAAVRAARTSAVYDAHRFHVRDRASDAAKRAIVRRWLAVRYPVFKERYSGNAVVLRELIVACQEEGFYPVLVELPLNLQIVRHAWDKPRQRYGRAARAAAADFGIPYLDFNARIGLVSRDFSDVYHLIEPGRAKYQRRLSQVVVASLKQYGLAP